MPLTLEQLFTLAPEQLLYQIFIPFIIIFAILWGVLTGLGIFGSKINLILSLALTIAITFTDAFVIFSTYLFQLGGYVAIIAFVGVFMFSLIVWAFRRGVESYYEHGPAEKRLERLTKDIAKVAEKYQSATGAKKEAYGGQLKTLMEKKKLLETELEQRGY